MKYAYDVQMMEKNVKILIDALSEILERAQDHPCFMHHSFETRDIDAICDEGGDCCDWTMVGIICEDALKEYEGVDETAVRWEGEA